ncbi:MAG TPA: cytochrome c biogenesis protein CcsA [Pirellulales bacterium]|jgi:ABC-type transport system involved in cytochrome c biogenesis permease subunit|nr:cytochrome c biogenesis protein CcsA [Pirellulales bacterium]
MANKRRNVSKETAALGRSAAQPDSSRPAPAAAAPRPAKDLLISILRPLASLKLTVVLMALAILLVFFGTLALQDMNEFEGMKNFFRTWICFVQFKNFFPKHFFPNVLFNRPTGITGGFYFPGGWIIGGLMALNLISAHAIRFKVQSRGTKLLSGLFTVAIGIAMTWFVIMLGPDKEGFQGTTGITWSGIHFYVAAGLIVLSLAALAPLTNLPLERRFERRLLTVAGAVVGALAIYVLWRGPEQIIDPSGLRILWQLMKATFAACVLLGGCMMLFQKRAGVVLLHGGLLLMMSNELVVYSLHAENRLSVHEGESSNVLMDMKSPELALIDTSNPTKDDVFAVPMSMLLSQGKLHDDRLPFDLELVKYLPNTSLEPPEPSQANLATRGVGLKFELSPAPRSTGVESSAEDMPSAYVRFRDKKTEADLGVYLLSYYFDPTVADVRWSQLGLNPDSVTAQALEANGKTYRVALRPMQTYRDYSIELHSIKKLDYVGTDTPRSYESTVTIHDAKRGDRDAKIWMNNPVRYQGETFYQSDYGAGQNGKKYSVFQVVSNTGWMIPYVGCMIVAVGMFFHFFQMLVRFLQRRERETDPTKVTALATSGSPAAAVAHPPAGTPPPESPPHLNEWQVWLPLAVPLAIVLSAAAGLVLAARIPEPAPDSPDFYAAGKLPTAYEGRVKPWDSLARNTLRVTANREYVDVLRDVVDSVGKPIMVQNLDGKSEPKKELVKITAIHWLLDTITHPAEARDYRAVRIESAELLSFFGLEPREGLRYSLNELQTNMDKFEEQAQALRNKPVDKLTEFEHKLLDLRRNLHMFVAIQDAFRLPPDADDPDLPPIRYLIAVAGMNNEGAFAGIPWAVPTADPKHPWEPLVLASTRVWLQELAVKSNKTTPDAFAQHLLDDLKDADRQRLINAQMFNVIEGIIEQMSPNETPENIRKSALEKFKLLPPEMRGPLEKEATAYLQKKLTDAVHAILGSHQLTDAPEHGAIVLRDLLEAYKANKVEAFNEQVAHYETALATEPPKEYQASRIDFEAFLNHLTPFPIAKWMYILAFALAGLSWLGAQQTFRRAATWLILLTFALHTLGLVGRIYISGRPPVTNLYSSAVFIGWGAVIFGLVLEWIYGLSLGNAIAAFAGAATLAVADHMALEGETLIVMQAVLDTNFWLATHVTCVTLGYTTTYISGLLGLGYLLGGMFTPGLSKETSKNLARMIYGTVCFAIFFSFVGTVLGGLWADDSWGRFWGWDPKENGALIIVLWNALVLHARWDGLVRERGLATLAIVGNIVTSWSWFGVNQLGLGRHSYGATRSVADMLVLLVLGHAILAIISLAPKHWWWSVRRQEKLAEK